ncbi:hypothetical protein P7K49_002264, partial [Saguinus oedipus]
SILDPTDASHALHKPSLQAGRLALTNPAQPGTPRLKPPAAHLPRGFRTPPHRREGPHPQPGATCTTHCGPPPRHWPRLPGTGSAATPTWSPGGTVALPVPEGRRENLQLGKTPKPAPPLHLRGPHTCNFSPPATSLLMQDALNLHPPYTPARPPKPARPLHLQPSNICKALCTCETPYT